MIPVERGGLTDRRPGSIMFVSTALRYGGAEAQVVLLASALSRKGWKVAVTSLRPPEAHLPELERANVDVFSLGMGRRVPDPRGLVRLVRLIRCHRPDVIHSHMVHANLLARVSRLLTPPCVLVCTAHNISEGPRWREYAYRVTDALADLTTNVSHAAVERYIAIRAVPAGRIRYMPNGIDFEKFRPAPESRRRLRTELDLDGRTILLAVGRFEPAKDYGNLLQAFSWVTRRHPSAYLLLVGDGPLKSEAMDLARSLQISGSVLFLGVRDDVPDLLNAADLYVMSSAWEGLPLVLLEASAVGLPIVTTDVGGNREIVKHGLTGLLVPPRDPTRLAEAIEDLLARPPNERAKMGAVGRSLAKREFEIGRVVAAWEQIYDSLWSRRKSG